MFVFAVLELPQERIDHFLVTQLLSPLIYSQSTLTNAAAIQTGFHQRSVLFVLVPGNTRQGSWCLHTPGAQKSVKSVPVGSCTC